MAQLISGLARRFSPCFLPAALLSLTLSALAEEPAHEFPAPISADDVRPHIAHLADPDLRGRRGEDAKRAADYVRQTFEDVGLKPLFADDEYLQPIPGVLGGDGQTREIGRNIGGWIKGADPERRDEIIIISAHYDHLGVRNGAIHPGADDNASGVSMLLETARQLAAAEEPPARSIAFLAFDLEEHLLWGSRWFVAHMPWPQKDVKLFITADMIGRSLGDLPLPTVFVLGSEHAPGLRTMFDTIGTPEGLEVARLGVDLIGTRSDYGPFRDEKIPFLFFSTGEHPDYHTPRDTVDRVDAEKVARVSNLILALVGHAAAAEAMPEWVDETGPDVGEAATVHRITQLLLDAEQDGEIKLGGVQKFFVTQVHGQTKGILDRGTLTPQERSDLVKAAQLLLLSVF